MAVENSDDIRLIVKIAQLYYERDIAQVQIAHEPGVCRIVVSRLLRRRHEQGIVTITINYDYDENLWLEQQLKQKFGLKEAAVVFCDSEWENEQFNTVGAYDAQLLERLLEPGDIIGLSWGRAIRGLVEGLSPANRSRQLICVPTIGEPSGELEGRYHVNTLAYGAATRFREESHLTDFPALLEDPLIRNGIMQSRHFKSISVYWDNLGTALVGTGSPAIYDDADWYTFYSNEESDDLHARQVAGDVCSRFYDINGITAETSMGEKTLSIRANRLKQARHSIDIAMDGGEYSGILGALRGNYIDCLITNSNIAELLLE